MESTEAPPNQARCTLLLSATNNAIPGYLGSGAVVFCALNTDEMEVDMSIAHMKLGLVVAVFMASVMTGAAWAASESPQDRERRIEQLKAQIARDEAKMAEIDAKIAQLRAKIDRLELCRRDASVCVESGLEYYSARDFGTAVSFFQLACEKGDLYGCNNLGLCYQNGEGVGRNYLEAKRLYYGACDAGVGIACYNLGDLYARRVISTNDPLLGSGYMAHIYYSKSCDLDYPQGCVRSGVYLAESDDEREARRSAYYFRKACDGGSDDGCHNLREVCSWWTFRPSGCPLF